MLLCCGARLGIYCRTFNASNLVKCFNAVLTSFGSVMRSVPEQHLYQLCYAYDYRQNAREEAGVA